MSDESFCSKCSRVSIRLQRPRKKQQPDQRQNSLEGDPQIQQPYQMKQQLQMPLQQVKEEIQQPNNDNKKKKFNIFQKIRKIQKTTKMLIRKVPFMRLVRRTAKIICDENKFDTPRFTYEAIVALQSVMEKTMTSIFEDANIITANSNRRTLFGKDINVLRKLRNAPWDHI